MPDGLVLSGGTDFLAGLDPEQRDAVTYTGSPLLVLAPAGTGKTRVLATRIALGFRSGRLSPSNTMAVTFTNKAAANLRERIAELVGEAVSPTALEEMWCGTFHSLSARILRNHPTLVGLRTGFRILDSDDSEMVLMRIIAKHAPDLAETPDELCREARRLLHLSQTLKPGMPEPYYALPARDLAIITDYEAELVATNSVDYGGLIGHVITIFRSHPDVRSAWGQRFQEVCVDEFQDTDGAQAEWLIHLMRDRRAIVCVGDDDQSIYGWRLSDPRHLLEFEKTWGETKTVILRRNYRSTPGIIAAAAKLIVHNQNRRAKSLSPAVPAHADRPPLVYKRFRVEQDEAKWIAAEAAALIKGGLRPADVAILLRVNRIADPITDALRDHQLRYILVGAAALEQRPEVKLALSWMKLAEDPLDDMAYERIALSPPFLIPRRKMDLLAASARRRGLPLRAAAIDRAGDVALSSHDFRPLDKLEEILPRHSDPIPLPQRLDRLTSDPVLAPAWRTGDTRSAFAGDDNLAELALRLVGYPSIETYLERTPFQVADEDAIDDSDPDALRILTMHSGKGLQFDTVFIPGWEEDVLPMLGRGNRVEDSVEEERRLAYVSLTRAKTQALITSSDHRRDRYGKPSRFLSELGVA